MKHNMMRMGILGLFCMLLIAGAGAQETYNSSGGRTPANRKKPPEKHGFDPQKLVYGGGIGLGFGDITSVAVSPVVGYRFTENFLAGVGLGFQYLRVKDYFQVYNSINAEYEYYPLKSTFFYPSVWARYLVYRNFFVHGEFEYDLQNFTAYRTDSDPNSSSYGSPVSYKLKYNSTALLLGAGIRQPISERSSLVVMALYDVIQDKYSPYLNRIDFRIGFNVGF